MDMGVGDQERQQGDAETRHSRIGTAMATLMRSAAADVTEGVIFDSLALDQGRYPIATVAMIRAFLDKGP